MIPWSVCGLQLLEGKKLSVGICDSEFSGWGKSPFVDKDDSKQMESDKPKIWNTCPFPKYLGEFHV